MQPPTHHPQAPVQEPHWSTYRGRQLETLAHIKKHNQTQTSERKETEKTTRGQRRANATILSNDKAGSHCLTGGSAYNQNNNTSFGWEYGVGLALDLKFLIAMHGTRQYFSF